MHLRCTVHRYYRFHQIASSCGFVHQVLESVREDGLCGHSMAWLGIQLPQIQAAAEHI